jgi:hypothetical protein
MIFFRASAFSSPRSDSPHRPDEDEDIVQKTFTVAEAKALASRGEIVDLKTAYGLTRLEP